MNLDYQELIAELYMLRPTAGDWEEFLKAESLEEHPSSVPQWFKEIAAQNPRYLEYREINRLDKRFYRMLPIFRFTVWAIPIVGFLLFELYLVEKGGLRGIMFLTTFKGGLPCLGSGAGFHNIEREHNTIVRERL